MEKDEKISQLVEILMGLSDEDFIVLDCLLIFCRG